MHVPITIDDQESVAVRRKILPFPSDAQGEPEKRGFASTVVCAKQLRDAMTILIVDDNAASQLVLTALLTSDGYRVLAARDGAEGLNLARTGRPELVISDVIMPVIDGYEFVRQLRRDPLTAKTAVIFYTAGYNKREARSLAEACGVSHVLEKPSKPEEILRAVSAELAGAAPPAVPLSDASFADTHRRMLTNKLSEKVDELQATHLAYQSIFDHAVEGIFQSTPQGTYVSINPALARIYGYDSPAEAREQINDIRRQLYVDPAQRVEFERRLREEGSVSDFETKIYRKNGTIVWVSENTRAVHNAAGEVVFYEGFVSDITKRKEAENSLRHAHAELEARIEERTSELARAREEADRANRAKSEFLLQMSHELRTPLNAVLGFAQLLEMEVNTDSARGSVEHILSGGRHLLKLINEALDIGRIEAGRLEMFIEPVNIAFLLQQAINLLHPLAAQREILLMLVDPPDDAPFAQGDAQRLTQVVLNLISNAIKYNQKGGSVKLRMSWDTEKMQVTVSDTGAGLSREKLGLLFTRFERLGTEITAVEGSGLGLAVSKCLIETMKGTIEVESEVGKGSTFSITLPLATADADDPARCQSSVCSGSAA